MRLHYQRVNPDTGGESFCLRFEGVGADGIGCLLFNAGRGVDVESILDRDRGERLLGIVLTGAHPECYCSLDANVGEDVPIYATRETAQIVAASLTGSEARSIERPERILDQFVVLDGWNQLLDGLAVHPVAVGHAPGSSGFLFEIVDGNAFRTVLVTHDYTLGSAAGFGGLSLPDDLAIDAVILPAPADSATNDTLTEACGVICDRTTTASSVLVTADEPTALHVTALLGQLGGTIDTPERTIPVGRVADLWEQLGYTNQHVTPVREGSPTVTNQNGVVVATPATPVEGRSHRLFERLADDPTAAVIRLTHREATPMAAARCMAQSLPWRHGPTTTAMQTVLEAIDPIQVVHATRQSSTSVPGVPSESFVWEVGDDLVYTLYDGTDWVAPAEVDGETSSRIRMQQPDRYDTPQVSEYGPQIPIPRRGQIDLTTDGVDLEVLREHFKPTEPPADQPAPRQAMRADSDSIDGAIDAIKANLSTIESIIEHDPFTATVVDAGGDICLLRITDAEPEFEHGETVELLIDPLDGSSPTESTRPQPSSTPEADERTDETIQN